MEHAMALRRLTKDQVDHFKEIRETAMGLHVTTTSNDPNEPVFVLGGAVLLIPDKGAPEEISKLMEEKWIQARSHLSYEERIEGFNHWLKSRSDAPKLAKQPPLRRDLLGLIIVRPRTLPLPPPPPSPPLPIYGHLPFSGNTEPNDVFYR